MEILFLDSTGKNKDKVVNNNNVKYIDVKNLDEQGYKHVVYFDHEETEPNIDKGEYLTQHPDTGQTGV